MNKGFCTIVRGAEICYNRYVMVKTKRQSYPVLFMAFLSLFWSVEVFFAPVASAEDEKADAGDLKGDIKDVEKELNKEQKKLDGLQAELNALNSSIYSTQAQINHVQSLIAQTEADIKSKEQKIQTLEKEMGLNRQVLAGLLQEFYYRNSLPFAEILLSEDEVSGLFSDTDNLFSTQEKIQALMDKLDQDKELVAQEKNNLEESQEDHAELLEFKSKQKAELSAAQNEVAEDVEAQEATVSELQSKLREMQSDLAILTGKSFDAKDIKEAVEFASDKTGVPKGVLYGFLKAETNLGANTGQCTYDEVKKDAMNRYYKKDKKKYKRSIELLEYRYDLFMDLVDKLDYSKKKKVSCTPSGYVGQGGAMGVAQFMADTWKGYESQIRSKTGHATPDPWSLTDGVMAMALKLKKAGATSDSSSAIKKASINYLGTYHAPYYNTILYWSKNYKKLF